MGVDVLGQSGVGNQGYYDTSHTTRSKQQRRRHHPIKNHEPNQELGHEREGDGDTGAANDIPPEVQASVEDGAIVE